MKNTAIAVLCAVIFGVIFYSLPVFAGDRSIPQRREQVVFSYAPLVKKVLPAVVNIYTKRIVATTYSPFAGDPFFEQFFGGSFGFGGITRKHVERSLGSGVIVSPDGVVVTNAHVVNGAQEISVVLSDGREFDADVSIIDKPSDLAVLRIDTGEKLPFAHLSSSDNLEVGDIVLAIGNPFGVGQTVTSGIVSALARSSLDVNDFNFFIQTDAAINPGNSGGPLVAMDGGVVGINTAIFSKSGGSMGIGFAIPSEMVKSVLAAERRGGKRLTGGANSGMRKPAVRIVRPWLGVDVQEITRDIAESMDLPGNTKGVLVTAIHDASPARAGGMKVGDIIISLNGKKIQNVPELKYRVAMVPIGEVYHVGVIRKGRNFIIDVEAVTPSEKPARDEVMLKGRHPFDGVRVSNINPAVIEEYGLASNARGVIVISSAGYFMPGDIIISINGKRVESVRKLKAVLKTAGFGRGGWNIVFDRGGNINRMMIR